MAIFGVLLRHLLETANQLKVSHPTLATYLRSGQNGVQLFFVVSAFTLFLSLERRRRDERRPWRNYFLRRFFRIAPMFWVALAFYWKWPIGAAEEGSAGFRTWGALAGAATFVNGLHPHWINSIVAGGWSVATEMLFYLLVPLLFLSIKNLRSALIFAVLAVVAGFAIHHNIRWDDPFISSHQRKELKHFYTEAGQAKSHGIHMVTPDNLKKADMEQTTWAAFIDFWLPNQIPVFAMGCVLFFLYRKLGEPGRRTEEDAAAAPHRPPRRGLAIALLLGAVAIFAIGPLHEFKYLQPHVLFGIGAVLLACSLAIWEFPLLVNSFWQYLGKISYSVYLTHWALLWLLADWIGTSVGGRHVASLPRMGLVLLLLVPLSMVLATITFYLIEQPGQVLGKRIIAWLEGAEQPHPVPAATV